MTLVVGMATGLIAVFVTFCTKWLTLLKFRSAGTVDDDTRVVVDVMHLIGNFQ